MIFQYLTFKANFNQHLMMVLVFLIFILYSLYSSLWISIYLLLGVGAVLSFFVYLLIKKQLNNRVVVHPQLLWKANKLRVERQNKYWQFLPFLIYSLLTIIHFGIVYQSGESILPLAYDYGLGGLFAIAFSYYQFKNWMIGIADEGLLIGSKLDGKLITWDNVKSVNYLTNKIGKNLIEINLNSNFPITKLTISNVKYIDDFKKLLEYKLD